MDEVGGEAHDGVERTADASGGNITDPLLYAVSAGFVQRMVVGNVIIDVGIAERVEGDVGAIDLGGESNFGISGARYLGISMC